LLEEVLLAAVGLSALLGGALLWLSRAKRRRAMLEARLKAIVMGVSSSDAPVVSLRRLPSRRKLLPSLSTTLDFPYTVTGGRVGPLHLVVIGMSAAATTGLVVWLAGFGPVIGAVFSVATAIGAPAMLLQFAQGWYQRQFLEIFPDALDLIVRAVRAGLPAPEAMEVVSREVRVPVGTAFQQLLDEMRIGTGMEEALQNAADRVRVPDFRFFVVSLLLQRQTGGGIAETLSNLSGIIRQRKALRQKARALTAEAQASAVAVAATPLIAGAGLFLINRQLISVLFVDPRGRFMLGLAIFCLVMGFVAIKALIKKNLS
jgi:tight adherence protein B